MKTPLKVRMFVVFFYTNYEWCHSARRIHIEAKMTKIVSMFKKLITKKKESENTMKKYEVKFNTQKIVVKDNTQSMMKSPYHMNKSYITKTGKNSFVLNMIAENFRDCLTKARQLYKDASSIEVKEIKKATSSMNLSNTNKQVA